MPDTKINRLAEKMETFMVENAKTTTSIATHVEHLTKELIDFKVLVQEHYVTKDVFNPTKIELNQLQKDVEKKYVTKTEFAPVKKIVYTAAGLILLGVFGALINLVVKSG